MPHFNPQPISGQSPVNKCRICVSGTLQGTLQLGPQPVSSHFTPTAQTRPVTHDLTIGVCPTCGVTQLLYPFPAADLVSPYSWITYREPEDHLDSVVEHIATLPSLRKDSSVLGLSFKDLSTLERLRQRGFHRIATLDVLSDLGANQSNAGVETVQSLLTKDTAKHLASRTGTADLIIARHILEHAEDARRFMGAIDTLLSPGGHLVVEVPDCRSNLEGMDYTMLWEEHASYFLPETLPQVLAATRMDCMTVSTYPYPFENVLVLYARKPTGRADAPEYGRKDVTEYVELTQRFGSGFSRWTEIYKTLFDRITSDGRRLAAYGAGHLTCAFLNFHGLAEYFDFVVDDTKDKQGLYMPGSGLPIVDRQNLKAESIACCLFGLAPGIEDRIIANNREYVQGGGRFASIFVDSSRSLRGMIPS